MLLVQVDILKAHLAAAQEKESQSVTTVGTLKADLAAAQQVVSTLKTDLAAAQQGEATARTDLAEMSARAELKAAVVLEVTGSERKHVLAQMAATSIDLGAVRVQLSMALAEVVESRTAADAATLLAMGAEQTAAVLEEQLRCICVQVNMELQDACSKVRVVGGQLSEARTEVAELRREAGAVAAHAAEERRAVAMQLAAVEMKAELAQERVCAEQADKAAAAAVAMQQLQSMADQLSGSEAEKAASRTSAVKAFACGVDALGHAVEMEEGRDRCAREEVEVLERGSLEEIAEAGNPES